MFIKKLLSEKQFKQWERSVYILTDNYINRWRWSYISGSRIIITLPCSFAWTWALITYTRKFIPQMFMQCLLCGRPCARQEGYTKEQNCILPLHFPLANLSFVPDMWSYFLNSLVSSERTEIMPFSSLLFLDQAWTRHTQLKSENVLPWWHLLLWILPIYSYIHEMSNLGFDVSNQVGYLYMQNFNFLIYKMGIITSALIFSSYFETSARERHMKAVVNS